MSYSPGHEKLSPSRSFKFHMRGSIAVDPSQKSTEKGRQSSVLDHREDPGVTDIGVCGSKVCQKNTLFLRGARNMGQGSGLSLKDVVRHLSGRDASLRGLYASHGVPVEASTKKLAIAIAQCQWALGLR